MPDPSADGKGTAPRRRGAGLVLLLSVFLVAICALIYELVAGAVSSYLLGSSVTQFSLVIGLFLTAMGVGSFLTQFVRERLLEAFLAVEAAVGLLGGAGALILFAAFTYTKSYLAALVGVVGILGILIGMEIPLILRLLRDLSGELRVTVAQVMAVDYIGALIASLAFPFILLPHLGLLRASFAAGLLNVAVALLGLWIFRADLRGAGRPLGLFTFAAAAVLLVGLGASQRLVSTMEARLYQDTIILARQTQYQRLVLTRWREDLRLFLDGELQFSTADEYRYHEALVHPAMSLAARRGQVLILGGGDGLGAREVLKYPEVQRVVIVDIDGELTALFRDNDLLSALSGHALRDPRVQVVNADARSWLEQSGDVFDVILCDLPDPNTLDLGKLYTVDFYALAMRRLSADGALATQATSPFFAPDAFWCIVRTLEETPSPRSLDARLSVRPYHAQVPSFGEWGFVLAAQGPLPPERLRLVVPTRFLTAETLPALFLFPGDLARRDVEPNRLQDQALVRYYEKGWQSFFSDQ